MLKGVCFIIFVKICCASCAGNKSLTFVIDDTESMVDDIDQVRKAASKIMDVVTSKRGSEVVDVILVTFNDPDFDVRKKTAEKWEFIEALNKIKVHGGGDCPEYSLSGISKALQESRQESYLYVFTDASAKDYHMFNEVKSLCEKKQSQVYFVVTIDDNYCPSSDGSYRNQFAAYYDIAKISNGLVMIIPKEDVIYILNTIQDTISDQRSVITSQVIPKSNEFVKVAFAVDDKTEYVTIHTSGSDVELYVTDNKHRMVGFEKTLWRPTVKMAKFFAPTTGTYYAWVRGDSDVTIVVYAATDFTFDHGFSEFVPKSLADASKQPIAGRPHYLSISVTDLDHTVFIKSAEILEMNEKVIKTLPLKKAIGNFYITEMFKSPLSMFKIQVTGEVIKTGKEIKRISKTAIEPQIPPPPAPKSPVVTIVEGSSLNVNYSANVELTCKVSGYPKPRIWWSSTDGTILSEKSNIVELPYDYISYLKLSNVKNPGAYYCSAQIGQDLKFSHIAVNPASPFTILTPPPETISVEYGEPATIRCNVKSSLPIRMKWFYQKDNHSPRSEVLASNKYTLSTNNKNLDIVSTRLDQVGKYTCEVSLINKENKKISFTTNVRINNLRTPEITYSNKTIIVMKGDAMSAVCITEGNPKPEVTWQFKSESSEGFTQLLDKGERISFSDIGYDKAGFYQCTSTNDLDSQSRVIEVAVHGIPKITNKDFVYFGVTGDKVLKIPCEAKGGPTPKITWKNGRNVVTSDDKIIVGANALYIKNPTEKDSKNFTCKVVNKYGYDEKNFIAEISDFIHYNEELNSNIYLKLDESTDIKCMLPHSDPQSIRWYVNGEKADVSGTYYSIKNGQYSNDGNYTCRLNTEEGSQSLNYVVDVGYKPSFKAVVPINVDWYGNKEDTLDCDVYAKPNAKVEWSYNGKPVDGKWPELSIFSWGQYSCKASNVHGSVQRTFNVISNGCLINRTAVVANHIPLLLDEQASWPAPATTNEFYTFSPNEIISLECATLTQPDNTFQKLPNAKIINVKCHTEDKFEFDKKIYSFSELQCKKEITPSHVFTTNKCMRNGEVVEVGFELTEGFLRVYEVCFRRVDRKILYNKVVMSSVNIGNIVSPSFKRNTKKGGLDIEPRNCMNTLRHLVSPEDVAFGPAQIATLSELYNTMPVFEPCEGSARLSWSSIELLVKSLLFSYDTVTVWTGGSKYDSDGVPRYLWKVVMFDDDTFDTIVYVNTADPKSRDILCPKTESDRFPDVTDASDQYTYICSMDDFSKAFKLPLSDFNSHS